MALQSPQKTRTQQTQDARSSLSPCVRMAWLRPCTGVGARAHQGVNLVTRSVLLLPTPGVLRDPIGHPTGISVREGKPPTRPHKVSKISKSHKSNSPEKEKD